MNHYRYLDNLITTNKQAVALTIAPMKVLLGIQSADVQFDALLTEHLNNAIDRVERYTETFLSRRDVEIPFSAWSGDLQLIGGGAITGLTVKDLSDVSIPFTSISAFKLNIESKVAFKVKYTAGQETPSEDLKQAILSIIDIKFNVKEIDEQESKISRVLNTLSRYVNASRRL